MKKNKRNQIFCACVLFFLANCGGGGDEENNGTSPRIANVEMYNMSSLQNSNPNIPNNTPSYTFKIGDYANFNAYLADQDLDITEIEMTQYYPKDSPNPYSGPDLFLINTQMNSDRSEIFIFRGFEDFKIEGPAGPWRIEFKAIDSKGNESNVFTRFIDVE